MLWFLYNIHYFFVASCVFGWVNVGLFLVFFCTFGFELVSISLGD